jgi:hypothetical protein
MAYIKKPGTNTDSVGKAATVASIAATGSNLANSKPISAMTTGEKLTTGAGLISTVKNIGGLKNEPQASQLEKPSAMARRLEPQQFSPQETLNILKRGEVAINELGRQDPAVFEQYYKPLADTMFAVYNDPRFAQFRNPNYGLDTRRG